MDSWTPERKAEKRAQMRAGLASPFRNLRLGLYLCFAGSGLIGGLVFLSRTLGGLIRGDYALGIENFWLFCLQITILVTMIVLFRAERSQEAKTTQQFLTKQRKIR